MIKHFDFLPFLSCVLIVGLVISAAIAYLSQEALVNQAGMGNSTTIQRFEQGKGE